MRSLSQKLFYDYMFSRLQDYMVKEGMCWVDEQTSERAYWFPGLFPDAAT